MNFSEENHQQLGALRADVENVKDDVAEIKSDMKKGFTEFGNDMKEVRAILNEAKGHWKMLLLIAGVAGAVGAALSKVAAWLPFLSSKN